VLISNYEGFKDLGTVRCFGFLSTIIDKKTAKQCYKRAKILKLIKHGTAAAREISQQLNQEKSQELNKSKVAISLKQFITHKLKNAGYNSGILNR